MDRQEQAVCDAEQRDHDAHREERVEEVDDLVELVVERLLVFGKAFDRDVGNCATASLIDSLTAATSADSSTAMSIVIGSLTYEIDSSVALLASEP